MVYKNKMKFDLFTHGFQKFKVDRKKIKVLNQIRKQIINVAKNTTKKKNLKIEDFHEMIDQDKNFNDIKLKIISGINKKNINTLLFEVLKENLIKFFGPDIAVQKKINLVIQKPYDPNFVTLHKDSPPNSAHELVVWIPLMNCKNTNAFKFLTIKNSKKIEEMFKRKYNEEKINTFAKKNAKSLNTNFGEFIIFWTGIYHFSGMNNEKSTRWSLNLRYKNLFSPYGSKGFLDYFEPISYSPLTSLGMK